MNAEVTPLPNRLHSRRLRTRLESFYDTSDRLSFEPLTLEDVLAIVGREHPDGVVVQVGGQTPLKLAVPLARAGVRIIGNCRTVGFIEGAMADGFHAAQAV